VIVLGIDPASGSSGLCLVDTEPDRHRVVLHTTNVAAKTSLKDLPEFTMARNLDAWEQQIESILLVHGVDLVVVEKVSVTMNLDTVRKISYFEAAAMLAAARAGVPAIMVQIVMARKEVFGRGNIKKPEADELVRTKLQPRVDWKSDDETDAYVLAIAGPALVDRRWEAHVTKKPRKRKKAA
jgi:Holliday junction resolvasome RuvABC endonuclease subunit